MRRGCNFTKGTLAITFAVGLLISCFCPPRFLVAVLAVMRQISVIFLICFLAVAVAAVLSGRMWRVRGMMCGLMSA